MNCYQILQLVPLFQFSIPQLEKGEDQVKELVLQEADDKIAVER